MLSVETIQAFSEISLDDLRKIIESLHTDEPKETIDRVPVWKL